MGVSFQERTLPNGLRIVGEIDPHAHTAACGFFVRTGARDESLALMGVSHFLEHMMFKGTARRSADDVNREFDAIGASYNAFTTSEMTAFHAQVLPERLDKATDILGDILRPALRQDDFDTEKNVILEEIAMYRDQPFWNLYERSIEEYYGAHPLAHRVLGTEDSIRALTRDQMRGYFEQRYSADNTVVAVAGRADFDRFIEQVRGLCGGWARTGAERANTRPAVNQRDFTLRDAKVTRGYVLMVSPAPDARDPRRYAAGMLMNLLGMPDNSLLHWSLIETGMAQEAQSGFDPRDGTGEYYVFASCDPERVDEVRKACEAQIARLAETITDADLERLRNKVATGITVAGERPAGRMHRLGRLFTAEGCYRTLEQELDAVNAVTVDELKRVWRDYPMQPRTVGVLLPA